MLPIIARHARVAFRHLDPEARAEAVQEVICNACQAYVRLAELGRTSLAYPTVLACYGVAQVKDGRKVGGKLNVNDVSSQYAQQRKCIVMERLDHYDEQEQGWIEAIVEDPHTPVFDQVWFRCDFPAWLQTLSPQKRRIAERLAMGYGTTAVAKRFGLSTGRISQIRGVLRESWAEFQGDPTEARRQAA